MSILFFNVSGNNGRLEAPIGSGDVIEIMNDGIYEISVSFVFQSVGGKRVWANLMRKNKSLSKQKEEGKLKIIIISK